MRKFTYLNLAVAIMLLPLAIINFYFGNIATAIFDLIIMGINLWFFLNAAATWWMQSEKIQNKFRFTCKYCGYSFAPSFWHWFIVPHIFSRRYFKCKECGKRHFMRRK